MVIGIFGESCVGKSTLAAPFKKNWAAKSSPAKTICGLPNRKLRKSLFRQKLQAALSGGPILYVISEKEHLSLLPEGAIRILVTADLETIRNRFASRMHGNLPEPIKAMLERKHGCFDAEPHQLHVTGSDWCAEEICRKIRALSTESGDAERWARR